MSSSRVYYLFERYIKSLGYNRLVWVNKLASRGCCAPGPRGDDPTKAAQLM